MKDKLPLVIFRSSPRKSGALPCDAQLGSMVSRSHHGEYTGLDRAHETARKDSSDLKSRRYVVHFGRIVRGFGGGVETQHSRTVDGDSAG